jgi:hypothetical protein
MKKFAFLVCGVLVLGFTSCGESNDKCTCTSTVDVGGSTISTTTTVVDNAGNKCSDGNSTTTVGDMTQTISCK